MKSKKIIFVAIVGIVLIGAVLLLQKNSATNSLSSSVLIGTTTYVDSTPTKLTDITIPTINDFQLVAGSSSLQTRPVDINFTTRYAAKIPTGNPNITYNVSVSWAPTKYLNTLRAQQLMDSINKLNIFEGKSIIIDTREHAFKLPTQMSAIRWISNTGYVSIDYHGSGHVMRASDYAATDWSIVQNNLLKVATEYMKIYPPIDAKDYALMSGNIGSTRMNLAFDGALKNLDLTKIPTITIK